MSTKWSKLGTMIDLGMLNHSGTHTEEQLIEEVNVQLAFSDTGKANSAATRREHLMLMTHPRVGPVFPQLLAEARRVVDAGEKGKMKLEHVLTDLCKHQALKTSGPPLVAFANETKQKATKRRSASAVKAAEKAPT